MDETRNANVNLTADVSQYNQATAQASRNTVALTDQVNKLVSALDGITKRMGKKLLIFSAADTAAMMGYTAAAAKYEKQLTTLRAQTELANKPLVSYKKGIEEIARQMPITGKEIVKLVTQINQLGVTSERQTLAMARTFTNLAAATGDDINVLTQGLIELSRQMGTLGSGATGIQNFADSLTTVSNKAGVSATAVLSFSQAIAPMARAAGIGQKEVLGIATAFTRAGADGFAAANTFNSMVSDITRQVMTSSPELAKYASAVGMTVEQFSNLDSTERIVRVFEAVTKAGPDAVKVIDRLGYDGIRAAKSIQAVANESGGLRKAIEDSVGAFGSGSTQKGANAAFNGLDAQMTKLRNNLEQIAAEIGDYLVPATTAFVAVLNRGLDIINQMSGPLLSVAGAIGALLAPVAGAFGVLMSAMGPLSSVMMAMTLFRLSPMRAAIQGVKEGMAEKTAATYRTTYVPSTDAGRHAAAGDLRRYQQVPYGWGQRLGGMIAGPPGPTPLGQLTLRGAIGASDMARSWYLDPTRQLLANAAMKDPFMRKSITGDMLDRAYDGSRSLGGAMRQAVSNPYAYLMARGGPLGAPGAPAPATPAYDVKAARQAARTAAEDVLRGGGSGQEANAAYKRTVDEHRALARSAGDVTAANKLQVRTTGELRESLAKTGRNIATLPLAYGRMGAGLAAQGAGRAASGLLGMIGGMVGMGAGAGAAIAGIGAVGYGMMKSKEGSERNIITADSLTNLSSINAALGLATKTLGEFQKETINAARAAEELKTAEDGFKLTYAERALSSGKDYNDPRVAGLTTQASGLAFLKSMGEINGEQARALAQDLAKRFGTQISKEITDQYVKDSKSFDKYTMSMGQLSGGLFGSAVQSTESGFWGGARQGLGNIVGSDDNATGAVQAAWLASAEQVGAVRERYGPEAAVAKEMANAFSLMNAAFEQPGGIGGGVVREQSIKQLEQITGDLGLIVNNDSIAYGGVGPTGFKLGATDIKSADEFWQYVLSPENQTAGGQQTRAKLAAAGLGASDLIGPSAKNMDEIAVNLQRGSMSDFERNVRSTGIGQFARTSGAVLAVTEGTKIGDTQAIGAATDALVDELTRSGASIGEVTTQTQKLAKAAGSASDPLFQLATAAQQLASVQLTAKGVREGGWVGGLAARWGENQAQLRTPKPGDAREQDLVDWETMKREGEEQAGAYLLALDSYQLSVVRSREDFHKSMVYAEEDFAKSMRRATEDAAKSMYDPFKRAFNTGTSGLDSVLLNMKRHQQLLADQVKNIQKLREAGFSQQAIDVMDLTNPANAFRVQRFVDGGVSRRQVKQANRLAASTTGSAGDLLDQQQNTRRAAEDFATQQARAQDSFSKNLKRAAEDFAKYGKEVLGTYEEILAKIDKKIKKSNLNRADLPFRQSLDDVLALLDGYLANAPKPDGEKGGATPQYDAYDNPKYRRRVADVSSGYTTGQYEERVPLPSQRRTGGRGSTMDRGAGGWGVNPENVPYLAAGGGVSGRTLAVLGETVSPEVVVPLNQVGAKWMGGVYADITREMVKGLKTSGHKSPVQYKGSGMQVANYETNYHIQKMTVESRNMADWERQVAYRTKEKNFRKGANAPIG